MIFMKLQPTYKFDIQNELSEKPDQMLMKFDGLWECEVCGKTSVNKYHAKSHTQTHMDSIPLALSSCG
jgi:hypothetical protein